MNAPATPERKRHLLEAGRHAFITNGYAASSVEEICRAAAVTKGGFFHYFESKSAFASAVLDDTWDQFLNAHASASDAPPLDALHQHIEFMVRFISSDGRIIPRLASEVGGSKPELSTQIGGYFAMWTSFVRNTLERSGYEDPQSMMEFIIAAIEGAPMVAGQLGAQVLDNTIAHLTHHLDEVLARP